MTERPILFSAPMVRAVLSGAKTQTRRVVKLDPATGYIRKGNKRWHRDDPAAIEACPYGQPGDKLWVREAFRLGLEWDDHNPRATPVGDVRWEADGRARLDDGSYVGRTDSDAWGRLRPSIHMPRWASRITLEVEAVRVERLQEISEADAEAEGVVPFPLDDEGDCWSDGLHRTAFNYLWCDMNGWYPNAWDANPWVWVVQFRGCESPRGAR